MVDDARGVDDLDRLGIEQLERHRGDVDGVAGHVAERTGAEIEPAPPVERLVIGVVRPIRGRAQELGPAILVGNARRVFGPADALRPDRAIGPDVDVLDRAQNPRSDQLDPRAEAILGGPLIAHLGTELLLGGERPHQPRLLDRPGQRLLAEAVLAHPHGHHAGRGVGVVGRADRHRVDLVAHLLEHLAVVEVLLRLGVLFTHLVEDFAVDVAQGDDLTVSAGVVGVTVSLAADADAREADLFIGRLTERASRGRRAADQESAGAGGRGLLEKLTTVHGEELRGLG